MSVSWIILLLMFAILFVTAFFAARAQRRSAPAVKDEPSHPAAGLGAATEESVDVLLVGAGAMSTTLGMLLQKLDPNLRLCMVEKLDEVARESTDALNNAGTGHAGNCELNYTPETPDGGIDPSKAFQINAAFEESMQLWTYLVEQNMLPDPASFITQVPHLSFVQGNDNIEFLRKRQEILKQSVAFGDMEFSEDHAQLKEWIPLIMEHRSRSEAVAATRVSYGTDVNFGELARSMTSCLAQHDNFDLRLGRTVVDLHQLEDRRWMVEIHNLRTGVREVVKARVVFLGAGGGALPLLQKSGIPEGRGYGGFPVSGQWLICNKSSIIERHQAKVYGKAAIGAPPMSVPHLDTRMIDGKRSLLFGPFAGFTTRYTKHGSLLDFVRSLTADNLKPMIVAGLDNVDLTLYLIKEVLQSHRDRMEALRHFYIDAHDKDWELEHAGKRVQVIKRGERKAGKLEFGTEVVSSSDGTLAALLGASPGASTTVNAMLDVLARCFPDRIQSHEWRSRLQEMIPSYGQDLLENDDLFRKVRERNIAVLNLNHLD